MISAVVKQSKEMSLLDLNQMLDDVLPLIETNLSAVELAGLLVVAPGFLGAEINQATLPIEGSYGVALGWEIILFIQWILKRMLHICRNYCMRMKANSFHFLSCLQNIKIALL